MAKYLLPQHVHFCTWGEMYIFLDLHQDQYTLINGTQARALKTLIQAQHAAHRPQGSPDGNGPFQVDFDQALRELLDVGLLTSDATHGKPVASTSIAGATESLLGPDLTNAPTIRFAHILNFAVSCLIAAVQLRTRKIESIVRSVERRKAQHARAIPRDIEKTRELVAVFKTLRAAFPADYLCLFDSLALIEFLARYDVFPNWIFAVQFEPWAAHCWVQDGRYIFNDGVEEASDYLPIMSI